ncbi:MAG: BsuPI-related putative proteinase inhibitor [Hadesarchaea archaeon]|nr:BsuPI-related putative proteinase inhibitor [Hadesarchaea archaeon]
MGEAVLDNVRMKLGLLAVVCATVIVVATVVFQSTSDDGKKYFTTFKDGSMFFSDAGESHGGFEFTAGYTVIISDNSFETGDTVHLTFELDIGFCDPLDVHDLYLKLSYSDADDEITLQNDSVVIRLVKVENDIIWDHQFDDYYIASWGGCAPEEEIRGEISPSVFGLPVHYYIELRLKAEVESDRNAGENITSVVENGAKLTISLDKTEFNQGENIDVKLVVQNLREKNVTFTFSSGYQFDLVVYDENFEVVCAWSDDKEFIEAFTSLSLEPGESHNWVWDWNQMVYEKLTGKYSPIVPGTYHLRGILIGYMETPFLRITIS